MSNEQIHPMVMKAARVYFIARWGKTPEQTPEWWSACKEQLCPLMEKVLTECWALELLEKAEKLEEAARCVQAGEWHKDSLQIERMEMQKAIAKATAVEVYGSAP